MSSEPGLVLLLGADRWRLTQCLVPDRPQIFGQSEGGEEANTVDCGTGKAFSPGLCRGLGSDKQGESRFANSGMCYAQRFIHGVQDAFAVGSGPRWPPARKVELAVACPTFRSGRGCRLARLSTRWFSILSVG